MVDLTQQREVIEEMARDLKHRAKLEREIHNDYSSARYLDEVAMTVSSVIELQEDNALLRHENMRLKKRIAALQQELMEGEV